MKFPANVTTPMSSNFLPELDDSEELNAEDQRFYQELIGILRWATEIGRVDILTEISLLSSYQASPRRGHLEQVIHFFAFLKKHPKLTLYFDAQEPRMDPSLFVGSTAAEFKEMYRDAHEELPFADPLLFTLLNFSIHTHIIPLSGICYSLERIHHSDCIRIFRPKGFDQKDEFQKPQ